MEEEPALQLGSVDSGGSSWMAKRSKNNSSKHPGSGLGLSIISTEDTRQTHVGNFDSGGASIRVEYGYHNRVGSRIRWIEKYELNGGAIIQLVYFAC